jgi:hypothetical protein
MQLFDILGDHPADRAKPRSIFVAPEVEAQATREDRVCEAGDRVLHELLHRRITVLTGPGACSASTRGNTAKSRRGGVRQQLRDWQNSDGKPKNVIVVQRIADPSEIRDRR